MSKPKPLRVGFLLTRLRQDQRILDPDNTDSIYQYYLLENLSIGMVRDSSQSPSGYSGGLAEAWRRESPKRWVFSLRSGLRWSDGSVIEPSAIVEHLENLRAGQQRHALYLHKLAGISLQGNSLILDFKVPVDENLIHELSLADTALLHPKNRKGDWSVVAGPYLVVSYDPGKKLKLKKNPFYIGESNYPEVVELLQVSSDMLGDPKAIAGLDLFRLPPPTFQDANQKLIPRFSQVVRGYPTGIYYLYFSPHKRAWKDIAAREELADLVEGVLSDIEYPDLKRERQLIPEGFAGHIAKRVPPARSRRGTIRQKTLRLSVLPPFNALKPVVGALKMACASREIVLEVSYSWEPAWEDKNSDLFLTLFTGNQRDALGSWNFLYSPKYGHLAPFRGEISTLFDRVVQSPDHEAREQALRALHTETLARRYAIPLFIEPAVIVASSRLDLGAINRFDMRLRFYELRWK